MPTTKQIVAGIVAAGAVAGGGSVVTDQQINPYTDRGATLEIEALSSLPEAGSVTDVVSKDEPKITLEKWGGEVALSVRYADMPANTTGARPFLSKNVDWDSGAETMEAVPIDATRSMDGGMEINIDLASKPTSNVFTFQLDNWRDLDFFYQGPLWQDEGLSAPMKDCTDTDCVVPWVTAHRPENVVGSYAVYYKDHADHIEGQTNYATGKAFHIFRPQASDANGTTVWAALSYDAGTLTVTVPQDFLDSATYPVKVDPTFGYAVIGASQAATCNMVGSIATTTQAGTATSISTYGNSISTTVDVVTALYSSTATTAPSTRLSTSTVVTMGTSAAWATTTITSYNLAANTGYWMFDWGSSATHDIYWDTGNTNQYNTQGSTYPNWPATFSPGTYFARKRSIYVTYTAATPSSSSFAPWQMLDF